MMAKFWQLLEESVITQSILTLLVVGTVCTLWIMGHPVPQELMELTFVVVSFWMGSKVGYKQGTNAGGA